MFGRRRFLSFPLKLNMFSDTHFHEVSRVGVVSGKAIFGPPLDEYWKKKHQEEAAAKQSDASSS
ncbi:hypothetical protein RJ641_011474 [Dillenia turbinata]|uniref:Uncharacterized protein n=1 Tax=Dillenia turbinata TaxID=194707 RepID=A0AAN8UW94_9MAGN